MIDYKSLTHFLFKNIGLASIVIGVGFLIFGTLNYVDLPYYYIADSGSPGSDAEMTVLINGILWLALCIIFVLIGIEFSFSSKKVAQVDYSGAGVYTIKFCLIGAFIILGTMVYLVLVLTNLVAPLQFFPNVLFVDEETLMDLSPIFNGALFFLLITVLYRVPYKLIKYGLKIGGSA